MGDFFCGWRRKIGVVTLVMACAFAAGWLRSLNTQDSYSVPISSIGCPSVHSSRARLGFGNEYPRIIPPLGLEVATGWVSLPLGDDMSNDVIPRMLEDDWIGAWKWSCGEFHFLTSRFDNENGRAAVVRWYVFPYWSIVIPLTLLSAWLLLSKPRKATRTHAEPAPDGT